MTQPPNPGESGAPEMVEHYDPQDIRSAYAQCQPPRRRPLTYTWTWKESRDLDPIEKLFAALNPPA